jgi:hypothetical protein
MSTELSITYPMHFRSGPKGQRQMASGPAPTPTPPPGRVPRLARLVALAIRLERLLAGGQVKDMAELARVGHVSRARMTQIMNLRFLAPDIQEALLFLPLTESGRDRVKEWEIRPIAATADWRRQRSMWKELLVVVGAAALPVREGCRR